MGALRMVYIPPLFSPTDYRLSSVAGGYKGSKIQKEAICQYFSTVTTRVMVLFLDCRCFPDNRPYLPEAHQDRRPDAFAWRDEPQASRSEALPLRWGGWSPLKPSGSTSVVSPARVRGSWRLSFALCEPRRRLFGESR